jgi:hypothetical protein
LTKRTLRVGPSPSKLAPTLDEQHWLAQLNEGLLYLHARGAVTLFDEILERAFDERLASHLPERVLPISTKPLTDVDILVDEQYTQVKELLKPGKRRRAEARAMLRGLLALEGHISEEVQVSEKDVNRVEKTKGIDGTQQPHLLFVETEMLAGEPKALLEADRAAALSVEDPHLPLVKRCLEQHLE